MLECQYCNLSFTEKKLLAAHQKTKKCTTHRFVYFQCRNCFISISGYDNAMAHQTLCQSTEPDANKLIAAFIEQMKQFKFDIKYNHNQENAEGQITFKKTNNYQHPTNLESGLVCPQKFSLYQKTYQHSDDLILGSNNLYLNDIFFKILRISDASQLLACKYDWSVFIDTMFFDSPFSVFNLKEDSIFVLGKIQCENQNGDKWYSDTFELKKDEKLVKLFWYRDSDLRQTFTNFGILVKDLLNLYLELGNQLLKKEKISFKKIKEEDTTERIKNVFCKYNLSLLVQNIQKMGDYDIFRETFMNKIKQQQQQVSTPFDNLKYTFKEEVLPAKLNEAYSLMNMSNIELKNNFHYLMYYILPDNEKQMFVHKQNEN